MTNDLAAGLWRLFDAARRGPRPFHELRAKAEVLYEEPVNVDEAAVLTAVRQEGDGGPVRAVMRAQLARWDFEATSDWSRGTPPNSRARRDAVYDAMHLDPGARAIIDERLPFFEAEPITVIAAKRWDPWYTAKRRSARTFFWEAFVGHLQTTQRWPEESTLSLDETTTAVVERLADPSRSEPYQAKGLVVGYVQSGKTANITGVVAKAADAGYRLVIVLAGTQNMLRNQTQRRLDKELLGAELVEDEYLDDADWEAFLRHGARPSALGSFDWIRLTGRIHDYRKLTAGAIESLKFRKPHADRPLNDPANLHALDAKLLVVKKNATVLDKLARDLARVNPGNELAEVPALVIDDESDQASVNTKRPSTDPDEETERTRINRAIVGLLRVLPRAQYVGYTATPFANVFIDPADAADLFPRDFIVSLRRPPGYLGARDFHDLDGTPSGIEKQPYRSNERAFVRPVYGNDASSEQLQRAIDSFVLSGAVKLYREKYGELRFRHHTMIVHTSHLTAEHKQQLAAVRALLEDGGYHSGECVARMRKVFESDFRPVSASRAPDLPFPGSFTELEVDIGETIGRLYHGGKPVLLVNSNADADQLAFNAEPIWKIIVGGAKLSRGFTVEGLTVSYFGRKSPTADTLMQMGRWCGFRLGHLDLVRLFIARSEPGADETFDAYEAFEAVCRDEDSFREELRRYAMPEDGNDPITPRDVPPLVASHLDWVKPTSRNKMYNATIEFRNFGGRFVEHRLVPTRNEDVAHNEGLFRSFFERLTLNDLPLNAGAASLRVIAGIADATSVRDLLHGYRWLENRRLLAAELEFLDGVQGDPETDDWAVLAPQLRRPTVDVTWSLPEYDLSVHHRKFFQGTNLVNAYAGPDDRNVARVIARVVEHQEVNDAVKELRQGKRGVLLVYPIIHARKVTKDWIPTIGFSLVFPSNHIKRQIGFVVRNPEHPDEPVVAV